MTKKCREFCKCLVYNYNSDDDGDLWGFKSYRCAKYDKDLGDFPNRCEECLLHNNSHNVKKGS